MTLGRKKSRNPVKFLRYCRKDKQVEFYQLNNDRFQKFDFPTQPYYNKIPDTQSRNIIQNQVDPNSNNLTNNNIYNNNQPIIPMIHPLPEKYSSDQEIKKNNNNEKFNINAIPTISTNISNIRSDLLDYSNDFIEQAELNDRLTEQLNQANAFNLLLDDPTNIDANRNQTFNDQSNLNQLPSSANDIQTNNLDNQDNITNNIDPQIIQESNFIEPPINNTTKINNSNSLAQSNNVGQSDSQVLPAPTIHTYEIKDFQIISQTEVLVLYKMSNS
ncbi:hypothetical protein M9Y10_004382 [Tritrichomonas musculus]|uniref:Uncharacterized protein n=1 Tax=Tritrichomonas musculus TaxID=1915356 RepID=A0ABR2JSP1_9EUKA